MILNRWFLVWYWYGQMNKSSSVPWDVVILPSSSKTAWGCNCIWANTPYHGPGTLQASFHLLGSWVKVIVDGLWTLVIDGKYFWQLSFSHHNIPYGLPGCCTELCTTWSASVLMLIAVKNPVGITHCSSALCKISRWLVAWRRAVWGNPLSIYADWSEYSGIRLWVWLT